jgi:hypothetical protein
MSSFTFRLIQRAEDLEALMNEEVTDINELISVINNIQVIVISLLRLDI